MNILLLQEADWFNKGPHQQHHLMERLSIRGHNVKIIDYPFPISEKTSFFSKRRVYKNKSRFYDGAKVDVHRPEFINLTFLNYLSNSIFTIYELNNLIHKFKPDIIIGYCSVLNNYLGMKEARKHDIPFIYYWVDIIHELIPEEILRPLGKKIEKEILHKSTKVLVINKMLGKYISNNFNMPEKQIHEIPGGVEVSKYNNVDKRTEIRKKFGFSDDDIILYFMGWIYEFTGLKEVANEIKNSKSKNIKMLIVGEGDHYEELKNFVTKNKLEDKIVLTGYQPHEMMPDFLSAIDICILPAHLNDIMRDIVPIKMYEYMASGSPVITTKLPGIMEEFGDGNGVIYVDKPEDVVRRTLELMEENKIRDEGKKALARVKENDWNEITERFENILMEVA